MTTHTASSTADALNQCVTHRKGRVPVTNPYNMQALAICALYPAQYHLYDLTPYPSPDPPRVTWNQDTGHWDLWFTDRGSNRHLQCHSPISFVREICRNEAFDCGNRLNISVTTHQTQKAGPQWNLVINGNVLGVTFKESTGAYWIDELQRYFYAGPIEPPPPPPKTYGAW